ncbi:endonuclease/exonuclease/phosphatase family protein [Patiriisocius marinistellae]|nr:endonuclease/exonuclease/phosphatase family protein [Patiriisocius marinistellae]
MLYIISIIFISTPFLPATENPHWFFRTADFVRLQSIAIELICLGFLLYFGNFNAVFDIVLMSLLVIVILYQFQKVYKYSSLTKEKSKHGESEGSVSILAANVLQTNHEYDRFIAEVDHYDPDLVLIMESDKKWEDAMSVIENRYTYTVKIPKDNFYGMHLYSKNELFNITTQEQIEDGVPSIFFDYKINKSTNVFFACLHPAPPSPTENETSKERDAELMHTGKIIRERNIPTVVCGDMNDVVWSRTTRLFEKMTNMIDPRVGRGFFATYHAKYFFMRFPLDHLFHTQDLFVGKMKRTRFFGSDHFGMYYEIHSKKKIKTPKTQPLENEDNEKVEEILEMVQPH